MTIMVSKYGKLYRPVEIDFTMVEAFSSDRDIITAHYKNGENYYVTSITEHDEMLTVSLKTLCKVLAPAYWKRINNGYIVSVPQIKSYSGYVKSGISVNMDGGSTYPLSRRNNSFRKTLNEMGVPNASKRK